jgi:hypothetical protein
VRGHRDLKLVSVGSVACALVALLLPVEVVRLLFAAPLALFLPGYAITSSAFARRFVTLPQLLTLSLGLSLTVLALGSLALNFVPGGLRAGSWAILLTLVVLATSREAALRRPKPGAWRGPKIERPRIPAAGGILLLAGTLAAAAAVALAFATLPAKHAVGYTELWMQSFDRPGLAGVRIGVGSEEQHRTAYRLRVRFGDGGEPAVRYFALNPGQTKAVRVPAKLPPSSHALPVVAALFRQDRSDRPYRRVSGWIASSVPTQ